MIYGDWRTTVWKHAFVYLWLAVAALAAMINEGLSSTELAGTLGLIGALGAWYWFWCVARAPGDIRGRVYVGGAVGVGLLLGVIDPAFIIIGIGVAAGHYFDNVRWVLALLVPCAAAWLGQKAATGDVSWAEASMALLLLASGTAAAGHTNTLAFQNAERQRLIDQLRAAQHDLAAVERRAGMLAERQRLARDIHDTLTQGLASIVMLLEAADASRTGAGAGANAGVEGDSEAAERHVGAALRAARDNLAECRRVIWALQPEALADAPLPDAIRRQVDRLGDETGVRVELVVTGRPRPLESEVETGLLRAAQEALANVRKHARATRVTVTISYMDDVTVLDVQDDGVGFDPAVTSGVGIDGGLGLPALRARAEELGGRLTLETAPDQGTTVAVEVPQ